jgi:hypothetical protein
MNFGLIFSELLLLLYVHSTQGLLMLHILRYRYTIQLGLGLRSTADRTG